MTNDNDEFASLLNKIETLKQMRAEAAGAEAELMKQLRAKGIKSLEAAKVEIQKLETRKAKLRKKLEREVARLEREIAAITIEEDQDSGGSDS